MRRKRRPAKEAALRVRRAKAGSPAIPECKEQRALGTDSRAQRFPRSDIIPRSPGLFAKFLIDTATKAQWRCACRPELFDFRTVERYISSQNRRLMPFRAGRRLVLV